MNGENTQRAPLQIDQGLSVVLSMKSYPDAQSRCDCHFFLNTIIQGVSEGKRGRVSQIWAQETYAVTDTLADGRAGRQTDGHGEGASLWSSQQGKWQAAALATSLGQVFFFLSPSSTFCYTQHWSATATKPLTREVNNTDHLVTLQWYTQSWQRHSLWQDPRFFFEEHVNRLALNNSFWKKDAFPF